MMLDEKRLLNALRNVDRVRKKLAVRFGLDPIAKEEVSIVLPLNYSLSAPIKSEKIVKEDGTIEYEIKEVHSPQGHVGYIVTRRVRESSADGTVREEETAYFLFKEPASIKVINENTGTESVLPIEPVEHRVLLDVLEAFRMRS